MININITNEALATPIPNSFIDNMHLAKPLHVLIYIYIYRHSYFGANSINTSDIANMFSVTEKEILEGLEYWHNKNIITYSGNAIDFKVKKGTLPNYTTEELEFYRKDNEKMRELFEFAEAKLERYLTYSDLNTIFRLYDYYRIPLDVLQVLLAYCCDNQHKNMAYIEQVAIDWVNSGVDSVEAATQKISGMNPSYRQIMKALGASCMPTPKQISYMDKWLKEFTLDIILEACDATSVAIAKPNMKYVNSVLTDWSKKNIKSVDDVKRETKVIKRTKFSNFEQPTWNFDDIERMERERLKKKFEGD